MELNSLPAGTHLVRHTKNKKTYLVDVTHQDLTKYPLAKPTLIWIRQADNGQYNGRGHINEALLELVTLNVPTQA